MFVIDLPAHYPTARLLQWLSGDRTAASARLHDDGYDFVTLRNEEPLLISLRFKLTVLEVKSNPQLPEPELKSLVRRILGLDQEVEAFESHACELGMERLVKHSPGLRVVQTPCAFDALIWSIIGQQITLTFANTVVKRLTEHVGTPHESGLICMPTPAQVAALSVEELLPLQFSRRKAEYLIDTAGLVESGVIPLEAMRDWAPLIAEEALLQVRGLGPWSVNYIMMRGLGFLDCVPLGDTGLRSGLERLHKLEEKPSREQILALMAPFAPYRSLATWHLWSGGGAE